MDGVRAALANSPTLEPMPITLRTFVDNAVRRRGPSTVDQLSEEAQSAGVTKARNPESAVRTALNQSDVAIPLADGRWTCMAWILDGAVLTHRVRASTAGRRDLWPRNDLFPFVPLIESGARLASGGTFGLAPMHRQRSPVLLGPDGWLPDVRPGALLAMAWRGGAFELSPAEVDPDAVADRVATLRDAFTYHRDANTLYQWRTPFASAVLAALLEVPGLLTVPLPQLGDVLGDLLRPPALPRRVPHLCCCRTADTMDGYYEAGGDLVDVIPPPGPEWDGAPVSPLVP